MSLKLKLKRAFRKAHKFIIFSVVSVIICFSACLPASALSVEFKHDRFVNEKLEFTVSNGLNYSKRFLPTNVINHTEQNYSEVTYWLEGYNPPSGNNSTSMYFRFDELGDIHVPSGSRIRIKFSVAYQGLEGYSPYITTALRIEGWKQPVRRNFGVIPYNSRLNLEFVADNTSSTTAKIDNFDINFVIYDNISVEGEFVFSWFYDSMQVVVEPIPPVGPSEKEYNSVNPGLIEEHNDLSNSIDSDIASYVADSKDMFGTDFGFTFNSFRSGIFLWTKFFNRFVDNLSFLNRFLIVSLSLGLFGFLLGMSHMLIGKTSSKNNINKNSRSWNRRE